MITTVTLNAAIDKVYEIDSEINLENVMRISSVSNGAGGKGLNVARIIKLCGGEVLATGLAGGYTGMLLKSLLEKDGIKSDFAEFDGETRCCINIIDKNNGSTEFLEPGCEISREECKNFLNYVYPKSIENSSMVTLSGSAPRGFDKDIYKKLVKIAKDRGKKVFLDTSGELLLEGIDAIPTMIKPNVEEFEDIYDIEIKSVDDVIEIAEKLHEKGIEYVVVSMGKEGALMVCEEGIFQAIPPSIDVVNTVGCGDSMVGAFALEIDRGKKPNEALVFAVGIASANALSFKTGDFDEIEAKKILEDIEIKKLK